MDASDYLDLSGLEADPLYTTFDAPANHVTPVGTVFDGVVELTIQGTSGGNAFVATASGALLPNGTHILTAAHVFTDVIGQPIPTITNVTATFDLAGGPVAINGLLNQIDIHQTWNRDIFAGSDIAIFELAAPAPAVAPRLDIFRGNTELFAVADKAGYGRAGQGMVQPQFPEGTKRDGENRYEFFADATTVPTSVLLYDFDNGTTANDAFGFRSRPNLGEGADEVMGAPGDSGGPSLVNGLIAGIVSYRTRLAGGQADINAVRDSSFGEIGADTRVSTFAGWIDQMVDIIAPNAPSTPNLLDADDTGVWTTDNETRVNTPRFTGTAEAGSTVRLFEGSTLRGTGTADVNGTWTITASSLPDGNHTLVARATDVADNVSQSSGQLTVTVDTQRPRAIFSKQRGTHTVAIDNVTVQFTNELSGLPEDIVNLVRDDLSLTANGSVNLLPGSQATLSVSGTTWTLGNLTAGGTSAPTASPGDYVVRTSPQGADIQDRAGNLLASTTVETWSQRLTFTKTTTDNVPVKVRIRGTSGTVEISGSVTSGSVTLSANRSEITKEGTGTLVIDSINSVNVPADFRFNANEGTTTFTANPGNTSVRNWSLYAVANVNINVPAGHHWKAITVGENGVLTNQAGTMVTGSLTFVDAAAAPFVSSGGSIVHDSNTSVPVSVTVGGMQITGTATGHVHLMHDTSDAIPTLRKFGSGTFALTGVSDKTVAINFVNEEGETEFHTNVGDTAIAGGVKWTVKVHEMPGSPASSVEFHASQNLVALDIAGGAVATVATSTAPNYKTLTVGSLAIAENGTLDLTNNGFIIDYAATMSQEDQDLQEAQVRSWIISGRGGVGLGYGTWTGWGITSSTAAAANASDPESRSVGYGVNLAMPLGSYTTFMGKTVDQSSLFFRYTITADLTLDGTVNDDDSTVQLAYYGTTGTDAEWITGDLDYDGDVDDDDVTLMGTFYGQSI
jgi:hypothetical protein